MKSRGVAVKAKDSLANIDATYRRVGDSEYLPYARNTSYVELATTVIPDKDGEFSRPLQFYELFFEANLGIDAVSKALYDFLTTFKCDILSICAGMDETKIRVTVLIRAYSTPPSTAELANSAKKIKREVKEEIESKQSESRLITEKKELSTEEVAEIKEKIEKQNEIIKQAEKENIPMLNSINEFVLDFDSESKIGTYDLLTSDMQIKSILPYSDLIKVFSACIEYITTVEKDLYYAVLKKSRTKSDFWEVIKPYIMRTFVSEGVLPSEDLPVLIAKLDKALFELYIVQDLIDDKLVSDIRIISPDSVRVRVRGKAYLSNTTFLNADDYVRFLSALAVKNGVDLSLPIQTFTDNSNASYALRMTITAGYLTATNFPILHIRKVSRKKMSSEELISAGMFDKKILSYLLWCGRNSRGVVFAGPPASGKTVLLNWFLDNAYEDTAEVLVIQENDELFSHRKNIAFEHIVQNPKKGQKACTLEDLGQMALVAGANVFVIGEAKGAEICSAITLSNSGCRTAMTIHSPSAEETTDKMADLALRGYADNYENAKRMIKSFQTIVYIRDFKIEEISEITGYDEAKKDMQYRTIYKRNFEKKYPS